MSWLGLDIGGANLKAALSPGWACSVPFALWRDPAGLADGLAKLISQAPAAEHIAVTMTGELCDCFRTKAEGVAHILAAVERAAAGRRIHVYLVDGRFASIAEARQQAHLAAASNWHALARFGSRYVEGRAGLIVDIGSTTTDLVPIVDGQPATKALTDTERLVAGQLVYTGVARTPLCAVTRTLPWHGEQCPLAAELFATTADAYLLVGDLPEQPDANWTADGRPFTRKFAHERMARMLCADTTSFSPDDALTAAEWVRQCQIADLSVAAAKVISTMPEPPAVWVTSGSGEFLASRLDGVSTIVSLGTELGRDASSAAAAHSVAVLADEML